MTFSALGHYAGRWLCDIISFRALGAFLSSFGALWLAVEIATFFLAGSKWPNAIREQWLWFGFSGIVAAVWMCKPKLTLAHKLNGRDVTIQISIGDMFTMPGALIIGSNTTFDTRISRELIAATSVQGIFTKKYYGDETQLDHELVTALDDQNFTTLNGKRVGKNKRYSFGTCARLNPKARTAYFVAIADINEHGTATSNFDSLKESLSRLWVFIGTRGLKESLVMPVLGTGFSRLSQTREEIVRETIRSFIAACSERTFADSLTIVITPQDAVKHHIALDELGAFLNHECRYANFSSDNRPAVGTPA
ncbi:MAG: macro domain-containing protein [Desulfomonilia bacterium]